MQYRTHRNQRVASVALIGKATRVARSAALLSESRDIDGGSNCACYAMFDAARAVEQSTPLVDAIRAFVEALR